MLTARVLLCHTVFALSLADGALPTLEVIEAEEIALVWDFDFDFLRLLAAIGAGQFAAGFVDCGRGFVVVPGFAAGVAAGVDAGGEKGGD